MESNAGKYGQRDEALRVDKEKRGMEARAQSQRGEVARPVRWLT